MFQLLLLSVISFTLSVPVFAQDTNEQNPLPAMTSPEFSGDSTANEPDESTESIENDLQLLDKEFFGYGRLLERRFGLLLGIGQTSPRHDFHLELIYAPLKFLRLSLSIDTTRRSKLDEEKKMTSAAFRARHHLTVLPIFFAIMAGGTKDSIKGVFPHTVEDVEESVNYDYYANSIYGGLLVGVYYFWNFGLYLETTVAGFSFHHALNTKIDAEYDAKDLEDEIGEKIIGAKLFGLLNGGLNIAIGYMF